MQKVKPDPFESRPPVVELLSDLKRCIRVQTWIIAAETAGLIALTVALIAK